jgi:hypothetical protein
MFETRVFPGRVFFPSLLAVMVASAGCAPGRHMVRLRTADGQVRTTVPSPRAALAIPDEQVHQAVRALARKVVPCADPLEFARKRMDVPVRGGVYVFNPHTRQIRPLDDAAAAREALPPELVAQARSYLGWCESIHKHGDCLQVLRNGGILDDHGRYAVAMAIAQGETIEATKASLKGMVNPDAVMAMMVSGMTMYMMLWVLPEPVSKGIAAVVTVALVVYLGVDTLYTLAWGWRDLVNAADKATSFEELQKAGTDFGKVMGADTARILFMLATAAMGSEAAGMAKIGPTLPGAVQASRLAVAEGGVALEALGVVESVTIAESGLTIGLAAGAEIHSSLMIGRGSGASGGESSASNPKNAVRLRKQLASEAGEAELKAGGGRPIAGAGTIYRIKDLPRLLAQYGGKEGDWAKFVSRDYQIDDLTAIQVHCYKNVSTGEIVELKSVLIP